MKNNKTWCKHIVWSFIYDQNVGNWKYKQGHEVFDIIHKGWNYCPICGTPRPRKLTTLEKVQKARCEYGVYQ